MYVVDTHSRFGHYFCSNLYGPAQRGPRGVKKIFFLLIKLLSFCANIAPKSHNLRKIIKIEKNYIKKTLCVLRVFRIFFYLGATLAHQTSNGMFSGPCCIFWHPRDPWSRSIWSIQRVPALHVFWDLEKTVLHETRVSGTVLWSPTNANSPTYTYISQKTCQWKPC